MKVYVVHGYAASPAAHWFPWLQRELERKGVAVCIVELPAPDAPQPAAWQQALAAHVGAVDGQTHFIGHSLGCIAILRYLDSLAGAPNIGGLVLVSGFNRRLPALPQLDAFAQPELDGAKLAAMAKTRVIIAARDDSIVPFAASEALAVALDAELVSVDKANHFLASDGFVQFPMALAELEKSLAAA